MRVGLAFDEVSRLMCSAGAASLTIAMTGIAVIIALGLVVALTPEGEALLLRADEAAHAIETLRRECEPGAEGQ